MMKKGITCLVLCLGLGFIPVIASAVDYHDKGLEAYGAGKYEVAMKYFKKAEKEYPNNAVVVYNLGLAHYQLGDYLSAKENLNLAISLNKEKGEIYFARGVVNLKNDRRDLAKKDFKKGCDLGYQMGCTVYSNL